MLLGAATGFGSAGRDGHAVAARVAADLLRDSSVLSENDVPLATLAYSSAGSDASDRRHTPKAKSTSSGSGISRESYVTLNFAR